MGQYRIIIEGVGSHHNGPAATHDADKLAADFIRQLLAGGHTIGRGTFEVVPMPQPHYDLWDQVRLEENEKIRRGDRAPSANLPVFGDPNA